MVIQNRRFLGRYTNNERTVNVYKGRVKSRSTDVYFYYYCGKRVLLSDADFHHKYKIVPDKMFAVKKWYL